MERKLTSEAASDLSLRPIDSVAAFEPLLSPVYIFLRRNQKFVAIKSALDFFEPAELDKYRSYESFFFAKSIEALLPIQGTAGRIRAVLSPAERSSLPPTPYELEDVSFRALRDLAQPRWDRLALAAFGNSLCGAWEPEQLASKREQGVELYEHALASAGLAVWLAVQVGYCELAYLKLLRRRVFEFDPGVSDASTQGLGAEGASIARFAYAHHMESFGLDDLAQSPERFCQKIAQRWAQPRRTPGRAASAPTSRGSA